MLVDKTKTDSGHFSITLLFKIICHFLTLIQAIQTGILNCSDMHKHIIVAIIWIDKTVTFLGVKPFNSALLHSISLQIQTKPADDLVSQIVARFS